MEREMLGLGAEKKDGLVGKGHGMRDPSGIAGDHWG